MPWLLTPDDTIVAYTGDGVKTRRQLCADIAAVSARLAAHPARDWLWWETDSYRFLCGALAVLATGRRLLLPPNATPAVWQALCADGAARLDELMTAGTAEAEAGAIALHDHAELLLFTSGSTGEPKRIARQLGQLRQEAETLESVFGAGTRGRIAVTTVSHQHIYGLLFKLLWPLRSGRAFLSHSCEFPEALLQALAQHADAVVISSPALLRRWPAELALPARTVFSSGGLLPTETRHALAAISSATLIEVLGSSETGGIAWREQADAAWQAMPDVEWRVDEDDRLLVRSAHACQPGWLATGDTAQAQGDGFQLGARQDRLIKLEEKRISLDAVEAALRTHHAIAEAHVLLTRRSGREEIAAVAVLTPAGQQQKTAQGPAFSRQLRQALRPVLEPLALPRRWRFVDALPVNAQGKIDKTTMLSLFENTPLTDDDKTLADTRRTQPEILALTVNGDTLLAQARVPADLCYLEGHFPEAAVVAGVAQLAWVEDFARRHLGLQGLFCKMEQLKFQQLLRPGMRFDMHLEYQRDKSRIAFRLNDDNHNFSSGRLVYLTEPTA